MTFVESVRSAARRSGVDLPEAMIDACARHFALLGTWNRTHNLTRIVEPEEAARAHYLDCLMPLLDWPAPATFVDIGSGAGFPGLLAALAWPQARGTLIEPARKRASFLTLAVHALALDARVRVAGIVEQVELGDRVLSRATFPPGERAKLAGRAADEGEVVVWAHPHDLSTWEAEVATWGFRSLPARHYRVEGLEPRCLLRATAAPRRDVPRGTPGATERCT